MMRITPNNGAASVTIYKYVLLVFFFFGLGNTYYSQNLVHNFEFNGNLNDSQPTGLTFFEPVTSNNSFSTNPNQWNWTATQAPGGGLFIATDKLPNPENYSLAIDFSFSDVSGKRKIVSFKDVFENKGVYFLAGGIDQVDGSIYGLGTLNANTFYKLIITRNATTKEVKTYIIGPSTVLQLLGTLTDTNNDAVPVNSNLDKRDFTFFLDDLSTNTEYTPSGSVRFIKIWDAPLSESQLNAIFTANVVATTLDASNITSNAATLFGEANPNGTNTTFSFEYGTTTAYGQTIAGNPASNNGNVTLPILADITGLQPNTTYHFRLKATYSSGDVFGADKTFTTPIQSFTSIEEASTVTTAGLYPFNINGTTFSAYVDANGWVLVANDVGTIVSQNLQEVSTLDATVRGVLTQTILSNLGNFNTLNLRSSDGVLDVISNNATLISRVKQSQTLHQGVNDNAINDSWVGASASNIKDDASCTTSNGTTLKENIIHTCGSSIGTNWFPIQGVRRIIDGSGNVANTISFGLWVKKIPTPTITSISNLSGCIGSNLTINGTGLSSLPSVTIGGAPVTVVSTTDTAVTVRIAAGASGAVQVTTLGGVATATDNFTISFNAAEPLGTGCNPFTAISQVNASTPNGTYTFNLNGSLFDTKVEGGWLLIANDIGPRVFEDLKEVQTLDGTIRGILNPTILSELNFLSGVKIKSSDGVLDVTSNDPTLKLRVKSGQTLHQGVNDNAINDTWTGASENNIKENASCTTSAGTTLKENIIHTCGSPTGTTWIPRSGVRRVIDGNGNVADTVSFGLWVQAAIPPTITNLSNLTGCIGSTLTINGTNLSTTQSVIIGGTAVNVISATNTNVIVKIVGGASGAVQVTTLDGVVTAADNFTIVFDTNQPLGTGCNPFTELYQVTAATPDGIYTFNLNGNLFETKVEGGWVLILNDGGAIVSGNLAELPSLDGTTRGLLSASALANLGNLNRVRIKSSDGVLNVISTNATIIDRIKLGQTLHQGQPDNTINDSWVGASENNIKDDASCPTTFGNALNGNIIHTCGSFIGTNWIPSQGIRRISDSSGNVASSVSFGLWVQSAIPPTITSLSATSGFCGSSLIINGTFLANTETVTIGGTPATIVGITDTSLTVTVGIGTTGTVSVTTNGGTATSAETFTVPINPADLLGSVCNPFTSVNQVTSATPDGLYHFNLNGNAFETKVEGGWVLVLNDPGASVNQGLQAINSLDVTKRGILSNSVLSNLGNINVINVKSSNGLVDVFSTNTTLISRLKASQTLHQGSNDNTINDSWTGVGAVYFTSDATCTSGDGNALNGNIIHTCGSFIGANWIPNRGIREITDASGFVGAGVSFGIWVQRIDPPTITSLSSLNGCTLSTLIINGTNLATAQTVTVGGTAATIISATDSSVTVQIGSGTTGTVQVTTAVGTVTSLDTYTVSNTFNPSEPLGTGCNPFTSIQQITPATPNGLYSFNLAGNAFVTKVEDGWVLVLNDVGTPVSQNLQEVTNLDINVRGIISSAALSNLGFVNSIKIKSSNAALDVESTNTTIINRVKADQTIHQGQNDNGINDSWVGASADRLKDDANCPSSFGTSLKGNIIHTCGSFTGTNWIPSAGLRKINEASGNVAATVSFGLWVKPSTPPTISSISNVTGCIGSNLTINGTNLSTVQSVTIGGTPVTVVSTTSTTVIVKIGAGASGAVQVTTLDGVATASDNFTITFNTAEPLGTGCNPFTEIKQVSASTPDGSYTFNLNGNLFETKVEKGWVLVANDIGAAVNQNLQEVATLDTATRGILNTVTLANLGDINRLKVRASNGLLDVSSASATLISRVKLGQTLHGGLVDNSINDSWTGVAALNLTGDATCNTTRGSTLKENIFHTCGNVNGIVWIPSVGERMILFNDDNVANDVSFGLWVKSENLLYPAGVSGANLWLKSNDGVTNSGSNLTQWLDKMDVNTFTKKGTIGYKNNSINFNPTASFSHDARTNVEPINRLDGNTAIDIGQAFAVYRNFTTTNKRNTSLLSKLNFTSLESKRGIFLSNNKSLDYIYFENANIFFAYQAFPGNIGYDKFAIQTLDYSPTAAPFANAWSNGKNILVEPAGGAQVDYTVLSSVTPLIGGYNSPFNYNFNGELAEIITFPSGLSALDRKKVESYLAIKYGITLDASVTNYVSSSGTPVWNNTTYWHDVFGIGKDSKSALDQTQSNSINTGSGDGIGQSAKGNIVLSAPSSLDDRDFVMIGHDNGALTEQTTDLPTNLSGKKRLGREWKVAKTNTPGTYNLSFDTKGLCLSIASSNDVKMLVDADGDGVFSTATTIDAASYGSGIVYFSNLDLPNNAVFTFLTAPPTIQLTSAVGTDAQTLCANTAMTNIVYTTTTKVTNAVVTGLPAGVSANFATNTLTISGTPTAAGVFNYTIQTSSAQCATVANVTGTITVTALPVKPIITPASSTSFCAPGSVVLSSSAATGNQWYKDGIAIAGATSSTYTATATGNYTVVVTQNGCVSLESNQVAVTANSASSAPTLNATGNTIICEGASVRLHTSSLTGNKWFKNGQEIAGVTGSDYSATETGSYTVETINTTGCVSGLSTPILVTVNPNRIVAPIAGSDTVCANSSSTLSSTTSGGVWSSSNTGIASIDGSGVVTGVSAGTATITYSVSNSSGCATSVTKTITVIAQPLQPTISASGATSFCAPDSVELTSSAATGNQWYKDGVAITGATASVYNALDAGSYTVSSTINGCASEESAAVVVTVSIPPVVDPIIGPDVVCAGSTIQLSNGILKGVWSSSNTGIATIDGTGLVTGVSRGSVTITFTVTTKFGCASSVTKDITVDPQPTQPIITPASSTSFCAPGSVVLNGSATTGNQWYKDGVAIVGATATSYTATTTGTYTVIVTQNGCVSPESNQVTVTANATPSIPTLNATGNKIICEGASVRLHTSSLTGNKWFKNGVEIPGETGSDYIATTSGSYTVESINPSGCVSGLSTPILVTVNPNRIVAPITGADRVCANTSSTLSSTTAGGVWSSSNTGIATIDGSGEVTGIIGGTVTITYSVSNSSGCVTSVTKTITVIPDPAIPVIGTSGPTSFCLPGSVVLSSSASTGNQWYKDNSPIVGATASVYTATDSGSYTVVNTQNGCSSSKSSAVVVQANGAPFLDPITGADAVCTSTTTLLSNTIPRGVWSSSNTGIATIDGSGLLTGISAGRVTITYTFTSRISGCSSSVSKEVTVTTLPSKPSVTTASSTSFCAPGSVVLRSSASSGNQWYKDGVAIVGATATTYTATDSGIYTVIVTQNSCVSAESNQVSVTANATPSIPTLNATGNTIICEGASVRLHTSSLTGNKWFKNGIEIPGETGSDYIATTSGSYTVETSNSTGCVSGTSAPILVTVDPNRIVAPITGPDTVCANSSSTLSSTTKTGVWSSSNTGIASIDGSGVVTGVSAGTVTIRYSEANSSGCVTSVSKTITVIAQPLQPTINASGVTSFCSPATVTLSSSATTGNQWYKNGIAITGATARVYTAVDAGSYTVISTVNGCASEESAAEIVTVSMPPVVDPIAGAAVVCAGSTIQLSNTILKGVWSSSNTGIASIDGTGLLTGVSAGTVTITFTVTTKFGCSSSVSKTITVTALPKKPSITTSGATSFCAPGSVVLRSSATTGNQWYKDGVAIVGATASNYTATVTGVYTVIVTQNSCVSVESDQVAVTANVIPTIPILNATGNTIICEGASVRLHTSSLTGNKWFKNGVEISGVTGSDYIATETGSYTVESINPTGCVSGLSTPMLVTVNPNRIVAPITGSDMVCANSSSTLSSTTSGGVWNSSNTGIASIDGSGVVTGVSAGKVTITYSVSNSSGCVTSVSKTITVLAQPVQPTITSSGPTSFSSPGSVVLFSNYTQGNQWFKDGASIIGETGNSYIATSTGIYTVVVTQNNCSSPISSPIVVTSFSSPSPPIIEIVASFPICQGQNVTFHTSSLIGNKWFKDGVEIPGVIDNFYTTNISGIYWVETNNPSANIIGISNKIQIVINPSPILPEITGPKNICVNATITLSNLVLNGTWSSANKGIAVVDSITGVVTGISPGTVTIFYQVINSSGCVSTKSIDLRVLSVPSKPTIIPASNTSFCSPGSVVLTSSASSGNQWYKDGVAITGAIANKYTATDSGSYTVQVSKNGCVSERSDVVVVTADSLPVLGPINGPNSINTGSTITLTNGVSGGVWSSSNSAVATITSSGIVTGIASGSVVISYILKNGLGCTSVVTKTLTVLDYVLNAVDDDYSATPFDASKEHVLEILTNDTENNGAINLPSVLVTIVDNDGLPNITIDSQGRLVIPPGSPVGTYGVMYTICDTSNPNNCATAAVTIVLKDPCDFDDSASSCDIVVRNAISPNNDGLNDVLIIDKIDSYPENSVEIYNRWGQLVFEVRGYDNTSNVFVGRSDSKTAIGKNEQLSPGTYYYVIKYKKPISGVNKQKVGFLYISI